MNVKLLLGGVLSFALLGLYIYSIVQAIRVAGECAERAAAVKNHTPNAELCDAQKSNLGNVSLILNLIGGLISATVVGVLAATKPNDLPAKGLFATNIGEVVEGISAYLPLIYILVWVGCGMAMVVFGLLVYEDDPAPPLTAQAKAWLGAAVAAVYAYFGIDRTAAPPPAPNNGG